LDAFIKESYMKKYIICFLSIIVTQVSLLGMRLESKIQPEKTDVFLSMNQLFQLSFLQDELSKYGPIINKQWSNNENIRILIERTELAVQQSSTASQELMKSKIIELFRNIGVNINFTSDNFIMLNINKINKKTDHLMHKKKNPHQIFFSANNIYDKANNPKPLARIHGARRTMNRLRKKRELQEKLDRQKLRMERQKILDEIYRKKEIINYEKQELERKPNTDTNQEDR
jgi:hypothetical protein